MTAEKSEAKKLGLSRKAFIGWTVGMLVALQLAAGLVCWYLHLSSQYTREFRIAAAGTTRIVVRTGGGCECGQGSPQQTLVEVTDPGAVEALIAGFDFKYDWGTRTSLEMCGWPTFEFYKGKQLAAVVTYLGPGNVRWDNGPWGSDTYLRPKSAEFLDNWLKKRGATEKQWRARQKTGERKEPK